MVVSIRLQRVGKKKQPVYRIVAIDSRERLYGEPLEVIGHYEPVHKKIQFSLDLYDKWLKTGAKPTQTVTNLYKRFTKNQKSNSETVNISNP